MEELPFKHIPGSPEESPSPKAESVKKKERKKSKVLIKRSDLPSSEVDMNDPEHYKMIEQMYSQQYFQSLFQMSQTGVLQGGSFVTQPAYLPAYKSDSASFMVKKEHEYSKSMTGVPTSPFAAKDFGLMHAAGLKVEAKPYGSQSSYEQYYHGDSNDENVNTGPNFTKIEAFGDRMFSDSPLRKKVKFNDAVSPNMLENRASKRNPRITDRTNKMVTNAQGPTKEYPSFNTLTYSPLNLKYESPSKMMSFYTPERGRDSRLQSANKPVIFNLNTVDKSPSLFMNKGSQYTFDKSSILKL